MGDERSRPDKTQASKKETPALSGRRKDANKHFADKSSQQVGSGGEAPSDNSPSVPAAIPTDTPIGQSGGEKKAKVKR
jgi:hypothetical protein